MVVCEAFLQAERRSVNKKIVMDIKLNYLRNFTLVKWLLSFRVINNLKNKILYVRKHHF